jgi:hypothetical protein
MSIPEEAVRAAWSKLASAMDCDPEDRGVYEVELIAGLATALEAAAPALKAEAWQEGWTHYRKHFDPNFPEFGINPYRSAE